MSSDFPGVVDRLKRVLKIDSDQALASELGMTQSAWSNRKTRGSLPTKHIDALIARYGLGRDFIYEEKGPTHSLDSESDRRALFAAKLHLLLGGPEARSLMHQNGYTDQDIDAVLGGHEPPSPALLRDARVILGADLHDLLCDEPPMQQAEEDLVRSFRASDELLRKAALAVLSVDAGSQSHRHVLHEPAPTQYAASSRKRQIGGGRD